jgi:hypothetical protein
MNRFPVVIIFACTLLVAILTISPWPVGIFEDDAMYAILGKSLAEGHGYRFLNLPGTPHATHYPPGYPVLLALLWRLGPAFPDNIVVFKFANAILLAIAAVGAYTLARRHLRLTTLGATAATLLSAATVPVLLVTGVVLSEPLFLAMLFPTLLLAERAVESGTTRDAALAGAAAALLALVRTLGGAALPATALALALRKKWVPAAVVLGVGFALMLPWQLWAAAHDGGLPPVLIGKYGSYSTWLADGFRQGGLQFATAVVARNVRDLAGLLTFTLMPTQAPWPRIAMVVVLAALAAIGAPRLLQRAPATAWFIAGYLAIVLVWPFEVHRFLIAIAPLVGFWVAMGIGAAYDARNAGPWKRAGSVAVLAGSVAMLGGFAVYNWRGVQHRWWESLQKNIAVKVKPVAEWVERHTALTDVLSIDHELLIYLYTGRQAVPYLPFTPGEHVKPLTDDERAVALRSILASYPVRYLITGSMTGVNAAKTLERTTPPGLRLAGSVRTALVFETNPVPSPR